MTIKQMRSFVVETEKNVRELFAQQANNGSKGSPQNPMQNRVIIRMERVLKGSAKHDQVGPLKYYNCLQFRHMACECQNPTVPCNNGQQYLITLAHGLKCMHRHLHQCSIMQLDP